MKGLHFFLPKQEKGKRISFHLSTILLSRGVAMESQSYTSSFAVIYDDVMQRVPYYYWYKYLKHLLAYYDKKPEKILELACGTGNMIKYFAKEADSIYGIDKSKDMLTVAQNKFYENDDVKLFNTDMSKKYKYGE